GSEVPSPAMASARRCPAFSLFQVVRAAEFREPCSASRCWLRRRQHPRVQTLRDRQEPSPEIRYVGRLASACSLSASQSLTLGARRKPSVQDWEFQGFQRASIPCASDYVASVPDGRAHVKPLVGLWRRSDRCAMPRIVAAVNRAECAQQACAYLIRRKV